MISSMVCNFVESGGDDVACRTDHQQERRVRGFDEKFHSRKQVIDRCDNRPPQRQRGKQTDFSGFQVFFTHFFAQPLACY